MSGGDGILRDVRHIRTGSLENESLVDATGTVHGPYFNSSPASPTIFVLPLGVYNFHDAKQPQCLNNVVQPE